MATIDKAFAIASKAHEGQKDKRGLPYIFHPLRVMNAVEGDEAKIVALLHDVVEDSEVRAEDLERAGFGPAVVDAVAGLTRGKNEGYADFVVRCNRNELARRVKLADLEDNLRPSRALLRPDQLEPDMARIRKYLLAYKYLTGLLTEEQYREAMKGEK